MRHGLRFFAPLLILAVLACSKAPPDNPRPSEVPSKVSAHSLYGQPVEIFVTRGGSNLRLGIVHPGMNAEFEIPPAFVDGTSVEFFVTPTVRGPTYRSGPLLLAPGSIVDMKIAAVLFSSTTSIRP